MSKLSNLMEKNRGLIYRGLIKQIQSAEGYGFHNCDQGHPFLYHKLEDIAERDRESAMNSMFELASSLAKDLLENDDEIVGSKHWVDLSSWDKFREFALQAWRAMQTPHEDGPN